MKTRKFKDIQANIEEIKDTEYGPRCGGVTRWKEVRLVVDSHKIE